MLKKHHRHSMEDCAKQVKLLTESLEQEHATCVEAEARVESLEKVMEVSGTSWLFLQWRG